MSWDIFVQDFPKRAKRIRDIPRNFRPKPIGKTRREAIAAIVEAFPYADFSDPSWGVVRGRDISAQVSLGEKEDLDGFAFHVYGITEAGIQKLWDILQNMGLRAIAAPPGDFLELSKAKAAYQKYVAYKMQITGRLRKQPKAKR